MFISFHFLFIPNLRNLGNSIQSFPLLSISSPVKLQFVNNGGKWCALLWAYVLGVFSHKCCSGVFCWPHVRAYSRTNVPQPCWSWGTHESWAAPRPQKCRSVVVLIFWSISANTADDFEIFFIFQRKFCPLLRISIFSYALS